MELYFVFDEGKFKITKSSKTSNTANSSSVKVELRLTQEVKLLLKKYIEVMNTEDVMDRFLCLCVLYPKFHAMKDKNPELFAYVVRSWVKDFHLLHGILFPKTTPCNKLFPIEKETKKKTVKRKKIKRSSI